MTDKLRDFGKRVKESRLALGLTQAELARRAELQESWISHFETGRRKPSIRNLLKLSDALRISADYLLGRELNRNILRVPVQQRQTPNG